MTTSLTEDLAGSVEQILWRDLRPVVVVVDSCSFGDGLPNEEDAAGFASFAGEKCSCDDCATGGFIEGGAGDRV